MNAREKMRLLEEVMEMEPGILQPEDRLTDYEEWDSLTVISLLAILDSRQDKKIDINQLKEIRTVEELLVIM